MASDSDLANLIWQIADLLRGPYRPPQYERVMLPLVVLRRFDCVLADTKSKVLAEFQRRKGGKLEDDALDRILNKASGHRFHNRSSMTFQTLIGDTPNLAGHLQAYISGFSANVRRIFEYFEFTNEIEKMNEANILYLVLKKFLDVDLHPNKVKNEQMGLVFENLIRRFNELANETAGDHFTPREVIHLMVDLLFMEANDLLTKDQFAVRMLDPACGTGGMLAGAQAYMRRYNPAAKLYVYGQDYNKRAFATAASDMLMKEVDHNGGGENIQFGDSFIDDRFEGQTFDYFIANPPFGVDWKKQQKEIVRRHEKAGKDSPWKAGLPRVNDGSLLFLQHMIAKFEEVDASKQKYGSRAAIVFSGSPLFTGGAGGGESEIRKWIIERDMLEAIVALPEQMFYNTGIGTYVWIVTNRKTNKRKGKIQLVDARDVWMPLRRSQGDKRRKIGEGPALDGDDRPDEPDQIADIVRLYGRYKPSEHSKIFDNEDFGYTRVTVERPLKLRYQMTMEDKARFLDAAPHLERKKAALALARFLKLHPHNIAQKTEVMIEHFHSATQHKIGGRAKAMVITGSRLEAVRYKQNFDRYIKEKGYPIKSLVAFSGVVADDKLKDVTYTEEGMNLGVREKELPEVFATQEYQVLLVAEKYQTGFDQPLLHSMYVDRRLSGIQAVQTLSRLNRIHPLKEDTFVLDFVNDRHEIRQAFKTYFEGVEIGEEVDPARMYEIKSELDADGVYEGTDVERFSAVYFKPRQRQSLNDHQLMNATLDPCVVRFKELQKDRPDEAELWRGKMLAFGNLYGFLSQIIPYQDSDLERLYVFLRHLAAKLPKRGSGPSYQFDDEVRLEYYRLQKISEGSISLSDGQAIRLDGPSEVGTGVLHEEAVPLSRLIDVVNDRFGTDFNQADQLFFDQIVEAAISDAALKQAAAVNPGDKFELVFKNLLEALFVERMDQNEEIFARFMNDRSFQKVVTGWLSSEAYRKLRLPAPGQTPSDEAADAPSNEPSPAEHR